MNERRDKLKIIHDMLSVVHEKSGKIKPTHLLYKSNLSYSKMQAYIKELSEKDLIKEAQSPSGKTYIITKAGIKFLEDYKRIKEFTDSFGF